MLYNKRCFFKEIFAFVFVVHLILLGVLFVCDTGKFHQERFVVNTNNLQSTVVFMPLKKRMQEQNKHSRAGSKKGGSRKVMSHNEYEKKLAAHKKKQKKAKKLAPKKKNIKPKPVVKPVVKTPVKPVPKMPVKKASTSLQQEKNKKIEQLKAQAQEKALLAAKKAAEKKALTEKEQALLAAKKIAEKVAMDKKILAEKQATEKAAALAAQQAKNKIEADKKSQTLEQEKVAHVQPVIIKEDVVESPVTEEKDEEDTTQEDDEDDIDLDNISFVGSHDLEMMQIKEQIQAEIVKYYKPPVGIAKKAVCELAVVVGIGGKAERVTVKKGSGSMANDMCARAALLQVKFPKEVIGKEIIVALGQ